MKVDDLYPGTERLATMSGSDHLGTHKQNAALEKANRRGNCRGSRTRIKS